MAARRGTAPIATGAASGAALPSWPLPAPTGGDGGGGPTPPATRRPPSPPPVPEGPRRRPTPRRRAGRQARGRGPTTKMQSPRRPAALSPAKAEKRAIRGTASGLHRGAVPRAERVPAPRRRRRPQPRRRALRRPRSPERAPRRRTSVVPVAPRSGCRPPPSAPPRLQSARAGALRRSIAGGGADGACGDQHATATHVTDPSSQEHPPDLHAAPSPPRRPSSAPSGAAGHAAPRVQRGAGGRSRGRCGRRRPLPWPARHRRPRPARHPRPRPARRRATHRGPWPARRCPGPAGGQPRPIPKQPKAAATQGNPRTEPSPGSHRVFGVEP